MDSGLKEILKTFGIKDDGEYYIDNDGKVKKKGFLIDDETGIYQDEDGHFKKKGFLFDDDTGLYQDKEGHFKKKGIIFDEKTGIYQDEDGNYMKEGIFFDEKTGYFKDQNGNIVEERFLFDNTRISIRNRNYSAPDNSEPMSDGEFWIKAIFYFFAFAIVITLIIIALAIAALLSPLIFFIIYVVQKRKKYIWSISSIITSVYLIYDINNAGFIVSNLFDSNVPNDLKTYASLFYFTVLFMSAGFAFDKFSTANMPVSNEGNFFTKQDIKTRRVDIAAICGLLIVVFSSIQFIGLFDFNTSSYIAKDNLTTPKAGNEKTNNYTNGTSENVAAFVGNAEISGSDVIIRADHSTQSKMLGSFKESGERVKILDEYTPSNKSEYVLNRNVTLDINGREYDLQKGKAVHLLAKTGSKASISFKDRDLNILKTKISYDYLKNIDNNKWYKVQRQDLKTGWVFGKFVNDLREDIGYIKTAVINDPDGYTNLRKGKGTNYPVVTKIYENEKFRVQPSDENWWHVKTHDGKEGYMYYNRIDIIN